MIRKRLISIIILMAVIIMAAGCRSSVISNYGGFVLYYINSSETALESVPYSPKKKGLDEVEEVIKAISKVSSEENHIAPLKGLKVKVGKFENGNIELIFGANYKVISQPKEVLIRAAVVKTLLQIDEIDGVTFTIGKEPLKDIYDSEVGIMNDNTFLDYFAKEQEQVLSEDFVLYYASGDGNSLIRETRRVYLSPSMSHEQAVMQSLLEPPNHQNAQNALPDNFVVSNITTSDNICYIEFDALYLRQSTGVARDVSIYSIVNSLCELNNIMSVQINIVSSDNTLTEEETELSGSYELNTDIVITP